MLGHIAKSIRPMIHCPKNMGPLFVCHDLSVCDMLHHSMLKLQCAHEHSVPHHKYTIIISKYCSSNFECLCFAGKTHWIGMEKSTWETHRYYHFRETICSFVCRDMICRCAISRLEVGSPARSHSIAACKRQLRSPSTIGCSPECTS